jgi:SHS2 domain-containing protein
MRRYEFIEHIADVGIKVFGHDEKELFLNAAYGFFALMTNIKTISPKESHFVRVKGDCLEELFFNWLNELLFLFDTKGFIGCKIIIEKRTPTKLLAKIKGERFDSNKHPLNTNIKAITYHNF